MLYPRSVLSLLCGGVDRLQTAKNGARGAPIGVNEPLRAIGNVSDKAYKVSGTTKDSTGAPLGNCVVDVFYTQDDTRAAQVLSDANGAFSFSIGPNLACYLVAYKAGSPDVAGTTVNTLVGV